MGSAAKQGAQHLSILKQSMDGDAEDRISDPADAAIDGGHSVGEFNRSTVADLVAANQLRCKR